jgi:hypothetical protein
VGRPGNCGCCCAACVTSIAESTSPTYDSQSRTTRLWFDEDASHGFTHETLSLNCSATIGVSASGSGRRLQIDASPSSARWIAAQVFWDSSGAEYDPHQGGSLFSLGATACIRWRNYQLASPADADGLPLIAFGPCIEWEGQKYYFWQLGASLPAFDNCGTSYSASAGDAASRNAWCFRHPRPSEGWSSIDGVTPCSRGILPDVLTQEFSPRQMGRSEDWLCAIDDGRGEFDFEERPDLSWHASDSKPITRFGFFVGLCSYRGGYALDAGTLDSKSADLILNSPGAAYSTWGIRQLPQTRDAPEWPAEQPQSTTELLNESLTTIPAGWPSFDLLRSDATIQPGTSFPGSFTDAPGYTAITAIGADDEYGNQCLQTTVALPKSWGAWSDDNFLRVSWTHRQFEPDQSQCNPPSGRTANNWSCGVSLYPFCRVTLRRDVANILGGTPVPGFSSTRCGANRCQLALNTDVQHGDRVGDSSLHFPPMFPVANGSDSDGYYYSQQEHWSFLEHIGCGSVSQQYGLAFASDGDRIEVTIRPAFSEAVIAEKLAQFQTNYDNSGGTQHPAAAVAYPQATFLVAMQIHGRTMTWYQQLNTGVDRGVWRGWWAEFGSELRLALVGWAGGGWSNLKAEWGGSV